MASTILSDNGVTSGSAGIKQTADNSGVLALQTTTAGGTATTALTIDTSQNVGLGVTPSAWSGATALQVGQYTSISGNSSYSGVGTNFFATSAGYATKYINNGYAAFYSQSASSGQHQWFTAPSGTAGNAITFTQAMTLDASGNLGIGITSIPSYNANLRTVSFNNTNGVVHDYCVNGTRTGSIVCQSGSFDFSTQTASCPVTFSTNGTERARIDSSGNLLVGTTSAWGGSPKAEFRQTTNTYWGLSTYNSGTSAGCGALLCRVDSTGVYQIGFYYGASTLVGTITTNGTGTTYGTSSDYRLKEDVKPMVGALNKVQALKPVTYKWKSNGSDGQGFIAHELQEVVPDCVTGEKDAMDENGNPIYQGIDTSFLVATLTAAIQEQQALIQTLTERITALETAKNA